MPNEPNIHPFEKELDFENALCELLPKHGWSDQILHHPTEQDLTDNWAAIIYDMNREKERLGNWPLTSSEMRQIIDQVNLCGSPFKVNKFINGKLVCIKRDNPDDKENYGKEVYLKIFDPAEISSGQSRYQIVRQPRFRTSNPLAGDRRGDVLLLINGMPVIHVELKRSRVDVSQAVFQLKRYMHEGVFSSGIFSMVQIFVAMTPEKTLYFANPGSEALFQQEFQFHWADFNNNEIREWNRVATELLNIPMAHQLIGYYTIADDKDATLKVLRSYQYYATSRICDITHKTNWDDHEHRGGYIWHTTGSGKTMTSFKAAQLIANSNDAEKVVFLMDRIELGIQSLDEYRGFAGEDDTIQDTQNTQVLVSKLDSTDLDNRLIVTSLQKMSNVVPGALIPSETIERIGKKRLVFIIDECHRSVFGEMLMSIKHTFPRALLFGFTGTPVFEENAHNEITTGTIFGDMLHKYTIANGIPDGNVLGFDPYRVNTYDDDELREKAAFARLKVHSVEEIEDNEEAMKVYDQFMREMPMVDTYTENGETKHGVEHYLPKRLYQQDIHHQAVAADIMSKFDRLSKNRKFHAILATKNIPEAIAYYELFKSQYSSMNVVAVFDNNIDNSDEGIAREDAILGMLEDYNARYQTSFGLPNYAQYKKDVAKRLAHKKPYKDIEHDHTKQIDLLIVVTQMLTGYDSKWVNTLYVDKVMKYVDVIQSFSRTNRLFGPDKPFGTIYYYTFPYTMEQNINDALEVYVDRPLGVFVDKLEDNLMNINRKFLHIRDIFFSHELFNFERLPDTREDRNMFAKDFSSMTRLIEAAKLQGFVWEQLEYEFRHDDTYTRVKMELDENTYLVLLQRYRELFEKDSGSEGGEDDFDYPVDTYITETGTGAIDAEYINSKFVRFIKKLYTDGPGSEPTKEALRELHKTFASLPQIDQRTAILMLHDIQCGDLRPEAGKTIQDYINEYQQKELHKQAILFAEATGVNISMLKALILDNPTEENLDDFSRFSELRNTLDNIKTKAFITKVEGEEPKPRMVISKGAKHLKAFVLDAEMREKILEAYLNDNMTLETVVVNHKTVEEGFDELEKAGQTQTGEAAIDKIKTEIEKVIASTLAETRNGMRPLNEIVNALFYVIDAKSIPSLDGVGLFLHSAFDNLYKEGATIVEKFVAFNLLCTKFEAYLKKLYYLMNGEEVPPREPGQEVTWSNVIHGIEPLWQLKYSADEGKQQLHQWLLIVKEWRNSESHISPTASETEINGAISVILTMYCYATGSCITELECNGHEIEESEPNEVAMSKRCFGDHEQRFAIAADSGFVPANELAEEQRMEVLRKSLKKMMNHGGFRHSDRTFCKQRHWIAVYRIATDEGFAIDGDFGYFKQMIDGMNLTNCPLPLNIEALERGIKGVYSTSFVDWSANGLAGKSLDEYNDIRHCAKVFLQILTENRPKK